MWPILRELLKYKWSHSNKNQWESSPSLKHSYNWWTLIHFCTIIDVLSHPYTIGDILSQSQYNLCSLVSEHQTDFDPFGTQVKYGYIITVFLILITYCNIYFLFYNCSSCTYPLKYIIILTIFIWMYAITWSLYIYLV